MNRDLGTRAEIEQTLDTPLDNVFSEEPAEAAARAAQDAAPTAYTEWGGGASSDEDYNLEAFVAAEITLGDHLAEQLAVAFTAPAQRMIGQYLIDLVDEAGYLPADLGQVAERLGASQADVEAVLAVLQTFDPPGVCARNLSECLAIQLRELNRYDPAMQALVEHLDLLAKRDIAALRKLCGVDDDDITDMIGEIRRLDPKPGLKFGSSRTQTMVPDVYVRPGPDGGWHVELNSDTLPRVLVNQTYYTELSKTIRKDGDKSYFTDCLQNATWLVRALDQRARTILKVATEIVRQQDGFFTHGVAHLRPLNLKAVADAIQMHELTVSRVTANKYMATNRGSFRTEVFLHRLDCLGRWRRGAFGRSGAPPHQATDRCRSPVGDPVRRHHRGTIARHRALILPAARSRSTAKRCAFPLRCNAAVTSKACSEMPSLPLRLPPTGPAIPRRPDCIRGKSR